MSKLTLTRLLTIIFTPVAAGVSAWVASLVPGVSVPPAGIVSLMVLGAGSVLLVGFHALQKNAEVVKVEEAIDKIADSVVGRIQADPLASAGADAILAKLEASKAEIITAVAGAVHAPPSVTDVVQQIAAQLGSTPAAVSPAPLTVVPDPSAPVPPAA